jgi:hypothetical protein
MKRSQSNQASFEKLPYYADFTDSLPSGVTISSAVAVHDVYPSGSALTITAVASSPGVWAYVPTGLVVGTNSFYILATTSDSKVLPAHRFIITTKE